jgi:hypothetical protein
LPTVFKNFLNYATNVFKWVEISLTRNFFISLYFLFHFSYLTGNFIARPRKAGNFIRWTTTSFLRNTVSFSLNTNRPCSRRVGTYRTFYSVAYSLEPTDWVSLEQCFSTAGPRPGSGPSSYRKKDLPGRGLTKVENHWSRGVYRHWYSGGALFDSRTWHRLPLLRFILVFPSSPAKFRDSTYVRLIASFGILSNLAIHVLFYHAPLYAKSR